MPKVSIGLPVFNGERYVEDSVRSVLDQTFTDFELIISDNASTDRTVEIIEKVVDGDPRVVVLRNDVNRGAAWNYNNVFEQSNGEFFRWHAHDDLLEPELIARLVEALDDDGIVLAHSWTRFIDDDGETTRHFVDDLGVTSERPSDRLVAAVRRVGYCNAVFGLVRRNVLARTALIGSFPGSDVPLIYELAVLGRFAVVPDALFVRRPGNSVKGNRSTKSVAHWFGPSGRGARFPGFWLWQATVRAIVRSPFSACRTRASDRGVPCCVADRLCPTPSAPRQEACGGVTAAGRWLWITAEIAPDPSTGGLVYSMELARAAARAGAEVTMIGLGDATDSERFRPIELVAVRGELRGGARSLLSKLPNQAFATAIAAFERELTAALSEPWDVVVIDSLRTAWAVDIAERLHRGTSVFITQNHDATVRRPRGFGGVALERSAGAPDARSMEGDASRTSRN